MAHPKIIQGGMGAGVSDWRLARAVSLCGQLGVVSGTALDAILARRLQLGDLDGSLRRAIQAFPVPTIADHVLEKYFNPAGKLPDTPFKPLPMHGASSPRVLAELTVLANFVEVFLAKEGHAGVVGINYLDKIQTPQLPSMYGAMLADVDYVLVGAGVPRHVPTVLDRLAVGDDVQMRLDVEGPEDGEDTWCRFDPRSIFDGQPPQLRRPKFLAIIGSATLAITLVKKTTGYVDGFVVEGPTAGGHNAPPRGQMQLNLRGEPIYGPRDVVELDKIKALGRPFWLAGSYGEPGLLTEAIALGASGIQVGTAFAFCEESGLAAELKRQVLDSSLSGTASVLTDPVASPTGFPFKVVKIAGSMSEEQDYNDRERRCDLGYLRHFYRKEDGSVGFRCPSEPVDQFVRKGGDLQETVGRKCICNGLLATIGLGQVRDGQIEKPIVTSGDRVANLERFVRPGHTSYSAADVIDVLLSGEPGERATAGP
jgi:nitronate monooxygenase